MKNILITILLLSLGGRVFAQKKADVRLNQITNTKEASCFDIELRSKNGEAIDLAGQNYRIFYNTDILGFQENKINSLLDRKAYSRMDVNNHSYDNIGFLSISVDGRELSDKVIHLNKEGHWTKVMDICFTKKSPEDFELVWATIEKTAQFATAEIALSEWISKRSQNIVIPNELVNYSSENHLEQIDKSIEVNIFPNPVSEYVNVEIKTPGAASQIIISDILGREIVYDQVDSNSTMTYDLVNWMDGLYTIEFIDSSGKRVHVQSILKIGR